MLPQVRERPLTTIRAADFGTLVHHWKETGETDPSWARESDIVCLEKKLMATGLEYSRTTWWWPAAEGRHEATFALNLATLELREHKNDGPRDEWKASFGPGWLTGTIDWLGWRLKPCYPWVDDLKTGRWPVSPDDNKQLLSYLLLPWVGMGCPSDWRAVASITQWPKYPLDGYPVRRESSRLITPVDMACHLDDLRWAIEHPTEINPTEEGCRFCDSKPICPAHAGNEG